MNAENSSPETQPTAPVQPEGTAGKWVVMAIVLVAVAAGMFAMWHHSGKGRRAMEYWGTDQAVAIRYAEEVILTSAEMPEGSSFNRFDLSEFHGLVHFRQALVDDGSFVFPPIDEADMQWDYKVTFMKKGIGPVHVVFDTNSAKVQLFKASSSLDASPIAKGLKTFFEDAQKNAPPIEKSVN